MCGDEWRREKWEERGNFPSLGSFYEKLFPHSLTSNTAQHYVYCLLSNENINDFRNNGCYQIAELGMQ